MTRPIENARLHENSLITFVPFLIAGFDLSFFSDHLLQKPRAGATNFRRLHRLDGNRALLISAAPLSVVGPPGLRVFNQS
jgi:hypothetical protein